MHIPFPSTPKTISEGIHPLLYTLSYTFLNLFTLFSTYFSHFTSKTPLFSVCFSHFAVINHRLFSALFTAKEDLIQ